MNRHKKTRTFSSLAASEVQVLVSSCDDNHSNRITRLASLKNRAKLQENHLWTLAAFNQQNEESYLARKAAHKLNDCGNYLLFKNYYTVGEVKLSKMRVCNQHLLCPFCASIRASRSITKNNPRVEEILRSNSKLKPVLLTFTVTNGADLAERQKHLMDAFRTLIKRRQDWLKKGWGYNEFCKLKGGFYSYENTYNEKTGEWHPHLHIFAVLEEWIDQAELAKTWHEITGDSFIVDIRRVRKHKELGYGKAIAEVCKYALKFGDLSVQKTWEAFMVLKGNRKIGLRLSGSFGLLRGIKLDDEATCDDDLKENLPYLEMVYNFVFGKNSFYNLVATRHIKPDSVTTADGLHGATTLERAHGGTEARSDARTIESGAARTTRNEEDVASERTEDVATVIADRALKRLAEHISSYGEHARSRMVLALMPDLELDVFDRVALERDAVLAASSEPD